MSPDCLLELLLSVFYGGAIWPKIGHFFDQKGLTWPKITQNGRNKGVGALSINNP
jgi:hypothetical protein